MANQSKLELILNFLLTGDGLKKAGDGLKEIHSKLSALKAAAKETWGLFKDAASVYFAPLKAVAVPAIAAITTAFGLAIKAVREFAGQELGEADVKSALVAMGQYTDQYRDQLIKLADTYQTTTGIADDMWLKSLGQLTRFGMNASNVDRVSEALKNLTGLMDGNLDGATDMLAKAMQGEFGMFSRYGIIIKQTGDQVKDLDAAITAINAKGVGLLEARAATLSGKWGQLGSQANEVFEAIGKKLVDSLEIGDAVTTAKGWLATLTASVQNGGLGDLISKGGKELKEHIEKAVKKAEEIATAIKKGDKSIEEVFSDALDAAAGVFWAAIVAGSKASMAIWKAAGIAIFDAIEEKLLASSWMQGTTTRMANKAVDSASPEQMAQWSDWRSKNPNATEPEFKAHVASGNSDDQIATLLKNMETEMKTIFTKMGTDMVAATNKAFGLSPDGKPTSGTSSAFTTGIDPVEAQRKYAEKMFNSGGVDPGAQSLPKKSMISTTDASGNEVTMALDEYIAQFKALEAKTAETVNAGTENATKTTETIEGATKAVEESTKSLDAVKSSHTSIETTMRSAAAAATATSQVATQTVQVTQQVVATQALQAGLLSSFQGDIARINAQLRSMRA